MAHMIDLSTDRPAIAYVGDTPWHGLGQRLTENASIEEWTREAGLEYNVLRSPVEFVTGSEENPRRVFEDRSVLYRSDTLAPLSVVSNRYKPVQPSVVMEYFRELTEIAGFKMETAGALDGGKRIWGLASVGDGANVFGHDEVRPYALLATSYDGTLATTAKFTSIRVVCHNTLSASAGAYDGVSFKKAENDTDRTLVRVPHRAEFNAAAVRAQLGIYQDEFEKMMIRARLLASRELDLAEAGTIAADILKPFTQKGVDVTQTIGYQRVINLFDGAGKGSDMAGPTLWGLVNAFTEWVDWERGRGSSRLNSAWFGPGNALKDRAFQKALAAA